MNLLRIIILFSAVFWLTDFMAESQTIIGTSDSRFATDGHNQRKIIRVSNGNMYIAYQDSSATGYYIKYYLSQRLTNLSAFK